jgi:hypothetical protein
VSIIKQDLLEVDPHVLDFHAVPPLIMIQVEIREDLVVLAVAEAAAVNRDNNGFCYGMQNTTFFVLKRNWLLFIAGFEPSY